MDRRSNSGYHRLADSGARAIRNRRAGYWIEPAPCQHLCSAGRLAVDGGGWRACGGRFATMSPTIKELIEDAVQVAQETKRVLSIQATAQQIAACVGAPARIDDIAEALLEACVRAGVAVEIDRRSAPPSMH
jgi:hypothetical protein